MAVVIVESRVFVQHYQKYTFGKYVFPSRECHTLFLKMWLLKVVFYDFRKNEQLNGKNICPTERLEF